MLRLKAFAKWCVILSVAVFAAVGASAQGGAVVLEGAQLARVVPSGFYFEGQSAPTQTRNTAAAKFATDRYVIVGMVDTSGYAADVRAKYEGFFITDSSIRINGSELKNGAYGFGFSDSGKMHILNLAGDEVHSTSTIKDNELKRPRPLQMIKSGDAVRLYSGRNYVIISAK